MTKAERNRTKPSNLGDTMTTDTKTDKGEVKVSKPKAKAVKATNFDVRLFANPKHNEVDHVKVNFMTTKVNMPIGITNKLKFSDLDISSLIKQLFAGLAKKNKDKRVIVGYKNVYGRATGFVLRDGNSYKSILTNHVTDGLDTVCFNQGIMGAIDRIHAIFTKHSLTYTKRGKTWAITTATKDNMVNLTKACKEWLNIKG